MGWMITRVREVQKQSTVPTAGKESLLGQTSVLSVGLNRKVEKHKRDSLMLTLMARRERASDTVSLVSAKRTGLAAMC